MKKLQFKKLSVDGDCTSIVGYKGNAFELHKEGRALYTMEVNKHYDQVFFSMKDVRKVTQEISKLTKEEVIPYCEDNDWNKGRGF